MESCSFGELVGLQFRTQSRHLLSYGDIPCVQPPPHSANSGVAGKYQLVNSATGRCLTIDPETGSRVVLLPCFTSSGPNAYGIWEFNKGISTVTSISSALTGQACSHAQGYRFVPDLTACVRATIGFGSV